MLDDRRDLLRGRHVVGGLRRRIGSGGNVQLDQDRPPGNGYLASTHLIGRPSRGVVHRFLHRRWPLGPTVGLVSDPGRVAKDAAGVRSLQVAAAAASATTSPSTSPSTSSPRLSTWTTSTNCDAPLPGAEAHPHRAHPGAARNRPRSAGDAAARFRASVPLDVRMCGPGQHSTDSSICSTLKYGHRSVAQPADRVRVGMPSCTRTPRSASWTGRARRRS
jgi:hypothetical protein